MTPELTFLYVPGEMIGYGRMGLYVAADLVSRGVRLYNSDGRPNPKMEDRTAAIRGTNAIAPETPTNTICWASTPSHAPGAYEGQYRAMLTMWESMRLPESFRDTFHEFELLMVPSWQNVELFSRFHDNVKLVTLGVDPELWHYIEPTPPSTTFDFLISGRGKRKGVDQAFEAFQTVFGSNFKPSLSQPIPRLIMKSLKGHGEYYAPGVKHVTGRLDAIEERNLYASAHCYLQPSRGEGFGLQPLQALALGRPTVLTNAHGHESYAHLGVGLDWKASDADYFMFGDAGEWWEPNFDELCEAMWDIYNNYEAHCLAAQASAEIIAKDWTWKNTTDQFLDALGDELTKPYTGSGVWRANEAKVYKVVTLKDHHMNAAGLDYQFVGGQEYYVVADVKRVLYDAGLLDPICLTDDDLGLAPQQLEGLDEYLAHKSHCYTCGSELNSRPNLADKYFKFDEMQRTIDRLEHENDLLRQTHLARVG